MTSDHWEKEYKMTRKCLELYCRGWILPEFLDLLGTSLGLRLVLGLVQGDLSVSLDQLSLEVQASLSLFLQLHTHRLQLDLHLSQTRLQQGASLYTTTQLSCELVRALTCAAAIQVCITYK